LLRLVTLLGAGATLLAVAGATAPASAGSTLKAPRPSESVTREASLSDPRASRGDGFGVATDIWGATAIVGSYGADGGQGTAYLYVKSKSGWPTAPTAVLEDPVHTLNDYFGIDVAICGNTAVVGASGTAASSGAAYIYVRGTSGWPTLPTVTLDDPEITANDQFGRAVAVYGSTVVVGAEGSNGDAGTAYTYVKGTSGWSTAPVHTFYDPSAAPHDQFGDAVALWKNTLVVGAGNTGLGSGATYVYVEGTGARWPSRPTATLHDPAATDDDHFGAGGGVAIKGSTVVVGAWGRSDSAGAAYIYSKSTSRWPTRPTVTLADPASHRGDTFGSAVAVSTVGVVVGAPDSGNNGPGTAYLYIPVSSAWPSKPTATMHDPGATGGDSFGAGYAVATSGTTLLIGAYGTRSGSGAAYVYEG